MTDMHRKGWTAGQLCLAAVYTLLCPLIGLFAFVEIYQTVTHLVHPWFGDWSWIVPASAEGMFTALYAGWVLLELRDDPPRRVRYLLAAFMCACGLGSYWLNISGAHGIAADAVAHAIVVTAFFGVLIFGKVLVRRLKVTPAERAMEAAAADARQYAIDLVRAVKGPLWRWRGDIPSLLRRHITSGRLPHEVREAVKLAVSVGRTSGWEKEVRGWVFGPDGLNLATLAEEASRIAMADITRQPAGDAPPAALQAGSTPALEAAPERTPGAALEPAPKATPRQPSRAALKLAPGRARNMTPDKLADHVEAMLEAHGDVSVNKIKKDLHAGGEKAQQALDIARRRRLSVVAGRPAPRTSRP